MSICTTTSPMVRIVKRRQRIVTTRRVVTVAIEAAKVVTVAAFMATGFFALWAIGCAA